MQITETLNEGLKRELKVVVPAADLEERLAKRLDDAKDRVQLKGFRPGKVPLGHLRKMYGKSFMAEVVNEILNDSRAILAERNEKSATQPQVSMTEDEKEAEKILAGQSDFAFTMSYEVLPEFALGDISKIKITREVVDIPDAEVDEQVERVASSARSYTAKDGKAADGDRVTMDYLGKIDGEPFEGGADQGANLVLGSGQFIPGFEEQLVGVKAGDEKVITVTFPADYSAAHLAGKDATFDIKVSEVAAPDELAIDDEMAKKLGLESLERLREIVRGQLESQYGSVTRQKVKRQILDALDESHKFDTPSTLVDAEFNNIWTQITRELEQAGQTFADEDTTEEEAREEYRRLAERRRLCELGLYDRRHDHLCDPLAVGDDDGLRPEVDEEHAQGSAIVAVDCPGRVRERDPVPQRKAGARADLHFETLRDLDAEPRRHHSPLHGRQHETRRAVALGKVRTDVRPGGTGRRVGRQRHLRVGPVLAQNPDHRTH